MAHLKDLIVSGVTRFIGNVYGTISNAIKDDKDQTISSTYIKDIEGGVNSLTITKGNGSNSVVSLNCPGQNLLINPNFKINQRGKSEYTSVGYTADRWYMAYLNKTEITENGIKVHNINANTSNPWMIQWIEFLPAGTYTLTVKLRKSRADMIVRVHTSGTKSTTEWQTVTAKFTTTADRSDYQLQMATTDSDSGALIDDWVEIAWAKLEKGPVATQFVPPNITIEQLKCQRYYLALPTYVRYPMTRRVTNEIDFIIPVNAKFRSDPKLIGTPVVYDSNSGAAQSGFTFTVASFGINAVAIRATKTNHGLTSAYLEVIDGLSLDAEI